jgi:uncharacterized membrane protein YesL
LETNISDYPLDFFRQDVILLFIHLGTVLQAEHKQVLELVDVGFQVANELVVVFHVFIKIIEDVFIVIDLVHFEKEVIQIINEGPLSASPFLFILSLVGRLKELKTLQYNKDKLWELHSIVLINSCLQSFHCKLLNIIVVHELN